MTHVLLRHRDIPDLDKFDVYKKNGGLAGLQKGRDQDAADGSDRCGKEFRAARPRRGGFPHGHEMVLHRQQELAALCGRQCRRIQAGHLQGSRDHGGTVSLSVPGGCRACKLCGRRDGRYVYLRGEFWKMAAFLDEKIAELEQAGYLGDKLFGSNFSLGSSRILARAPTSAAKRPPCWNCSRANADEPRVRPPFPPLWPVRQADHYQ